MAEQLEILKIKTKNMEITNFPSLSLSLRQSFFPFISRRIFGHFTELRGDKYASTIDSAPADVFLVIHIYDEVCCC